MPFIDTHAHLDGNEYADDIHLVVERARTAGCEAILVPSIDVATAVAAARLCRRYDGYMRPMIGLHPEEVRDDYADVIAQLRSIYNADPEQYVAIGEVGLDYYWSRDYEQEQLRAFEAQVRWAVEARLPLMIHCRKAQNELLAVLRQYRDELCGGVFHCFTGNEREAEELLAFPGFALGIGGVLTFKKCRLPETLANAVPLQRIVLETDSPYMSPVPLRGQRNESANIVYVIDRLAEAYAVSRDEVERITTHTARRLFCLDDTAAASR